MTKHFCDICGKELTEREQERFGKAAFQADPRGYFIPSHSKAVVNKEGKVVRHQWSDQLYLCTDCGTMMNDAIWTGLNKIQKNLPKSRSVKVIAPFMNEDVIEPVPEEIHKIENCCTFE